MVLANQCVAHIMMYQNEQAEEVMKRIERDENKAMLAVRPLQGMLYAAVLFFTEGQCSAESKRERRSPMIINACLYHAQHASLSAILTGPR